MTNHDNDTKEVVLALLPKFTSVPSLVGSVWIVYDILGRQRLKKKRASQGGGGRQERRSDTTRTSTNGGGRGLAVFHRILLVFSIHNIVLSIMYFLSTWPVPPSETTTTTPFASGTSTTCRIQGSILQYSGMACTLSNTCLAIYYVLVIKYNRKDSCLEMFWERIFYGGSMLFALTTAVIPLPFDMYHDAQVVGCWIAAPPECSSQSSNIGADDACSPTLEHGLRLGMFYVPLWSCFLIIFVSYVMIFRKVHKTEQRLRKYNFEEQATRNTRNQDKTNATTRRTTNLTTINNESNNNEDNDKEQEKPKQHEQEMVCTRRPALSAAGGDGVGKVVRQATQPYLGEKSKQVLVQASLYIFAFYLTWIWVTMLSLIKWVKEDRHPYALHILSNTFAPLQGYWNFLIYIRPTYNLNRKYNTGGNDADHNVTRWQAFMRTIQGIEPSMTRPCTNNKFTATGNTTTTANHNDNAINSVKNDKKNQHHQQSAPCNQRIFLQEQPQPCLNDESEAGVYAIGAKEETKGEGEYNKASEEMIFAPTSVNREETVLEDSAAQPVLLPVL